MFPPDLKAQMKIRANRKHTPSFKSNFFNSLLFPINDAVAFCAPCDKCHASIRLFPQTCCRVWIAAVLKSCKEHLCKTPTVQCVWMKKEKPSLTAWWSQQCDLFYVWIGLDSHKTSYLFNPNKKPYVKRTVWGFTGSHCALPRKSSSPVCITTFISHFSICTD